MKKHYLLASLFILFLISFQSCSDNDDEYIAVSPVIVDLTQVPFPKLSDYKFFEGDLKDQNPALNVLPYEPVVLFLQIMHIKKGLSGCPMELPQPMMVIIRY